MNSLFPEINNADDDGLLAVSYNINCDMILNAYNHGIFPWPCDDNYIPWFSPPERGILNFNDFKIPKSFQREMKKYDFYFQINKNFEDVIINCSQTKRKGQSGTWITNKMIDSYIELHEKGFAWSFETINQNNELIGGLYGVMLDNIFAGESMFYKVSGASKFALIKTVEFLKNKNHKLMDIQTLTPLLELFGGKIIPRDAFLSHLKEK